MAYFIAFLVIIGIYGVIKDWAVKIVGNEELVNNILEFFFQLVKVVFLGYIVFWFVYSAIVTWG